MAEGLGMTKEEWQELRAQVDDSFWVMRVIGKLLVDPGRPRPFSQLNRISSAPK